MAFSDVVGHIVGGVTALAVIVGVVVLAIFGNRNTDDTSTVYVQRDPTTRVLVQQPPLIVHSPSASPLPPWGRTVVVNQSSSGGSFSPPASVFVSPSPNGNPSSAAPFGGIPSFGVPPSTVPPGASPSFGNPGSGANFGGG